MRIELHGKFADDYETGFEIKADTVAEAIDGWSRQVNFYGDMTVEERPVVRVLGFDTEDSLYEPTEQKVIHLVPAMMGGGGKFGSILIGAALIGLSIAAPPLGIGTKVATALMATGIGMALTGIMGLFMKAPTVTKEQEASKYLGLGNNTTEIGTPIAFCLGEVSINGHVLALNVDSSDMVSGTFPANPT
jgi:predicted phage tail protein